jgi:hypothetical protein
MACKLLHLVDCRVINRGKIHAVSRTSTPNKNKNKTKGFEHEKANENKLLYSFQPRLGHSLGYLVSGPSATGRDGAGEGDDG